MTNKLRTLFAFSAIGMSLAGALPAFANDLAPLHVTVPFAFTAGKTSLPAGDYTVTEENSHVIMLKGSHGSAILVSSSGDEDADKVGLSFEHTGNGYFLKCIHGAGKPSNIVPVINASDVAKQ